MGGSGGDSGGAGGGMFSLPNIPDIQLPNIPGITNPAAALTVPTKKIVPVVNTHQPSAQYQPPPWWQNLTGNMNPVSVKGPAPTQTPKLLGSDL